MIDANRDEDHVRRVRALKGAVFAALITLARARLADRVAFTAREQVRRE